MDSTEAMSQNVADLFGLIYRNLIRNENDGISFNSDSQTALLSVLLRNGPSKMSDIGKLLNVTKPNVTFLVDKMEEQGLIRREKDAEDRRIYKICLTEHGNALINEKKASLHQRIADKLGLLSQEEATSFQQAMGTITEILRKLYRADLQYNEKE